MGVGRSAVEDFACKRWTAAVRLVCYLLVGFASSSGRSVQKILHAIHG